MRCFIFLSCLFIAGRVTFAQQVVQQPVVGATSVSTSVSVPDRGTVFLGGVSSAQSGRTQYGPVPTGPAIGLTRQGTSMSVNVYIHDFQAMDEALLKTPTSRTASVRTKSESVVRTAAEPVAVDPAIKAAKYEQLARKADDEGRFGVAKLHWQMAAKYGSQAAKDRLAAGPASIPTQSSQTAGR